MGVLFRKAIRSAIASVVGCESVQVTVTLDAPTPGPTYPIDIKAGSYEEAQEMYNKISMLQHTKSNNKITNVLNAQGLITLKSTVFALEQVEGKDGDTFSQRNANQHTTEIHTSNMLRKKKILHSECNIRSSELIILKNVAKSLKRKYTSSMSMNNNNIEFVKLVRQYGEVRKQIKYDIKFIKTHGCPPMPATETTTKETKMNSKAIEAAMKAADAAESQLATLSDMTSIIAAAQANITASSNASNTTMLNSTAAVTNTTTTNTTTSDLVVENEENEENENEKTLPTRNATVKKGNRTINKPIKMTGTLYITGIPSPVPVDAISNALALSFGVDSSDIEINEIAAAVDDEDEQKDEQDEQEEKE